MARLKPWVAHRDQSDPWYCTHRDDVGRLDCVNAVQLIVTPSPLPDLPYLFLIVERCPAHLLRSQGVLPYEPAEPPIDDGPQDCWGAF